MTLSVVIVSYNVKHFLEQCLCSVQRAAGNDTEVIVVDNQSTDGTVSYLEPEFPFARFISNTENVGFAKANNQALTMTRGKYVLFLNPDTIIPEDLFTKVIAFMDAHTDAGALGVRMIDGNGQFLPESKRGFPTPWVAFCKMSGLTSLFPRSAFFSKYYMGHLPATETHAVDALAGACMLVRKDVLDKTGGFDEQFFMYAEDIDLSYRIRQAGYKNYYFAPSTIIHFKGESTRRDKRYVQLFYKAMIQFVRKHFGKKVLLEWAIRIRTGLASLGSTYSRATTYSTLSPQHSFYVTGDERSCKEIPPTKPGSAGQHPTLFCEGPTFSFHEVIDELQQMPPDLKIFIHGYDTRSIIGSAHSDGQGEVFYW